MAERLPGKDTLRKVASKETGERDFPSACPGAPDTARRGVLLMVHQNANKGGTTQALLRPLGRERLFFIPLDADEGLALKEVSE